ncbi:MAG: DNA methyltransferase [Chloroflexota bacterium]|nr:DNA methyltransferase [Chloroflexota bacterium]MDE2841458.1 DNA methyltransferase [Chloroflexota bacterium]
MEPQTLYYGDCLDWMRKWPSECVDRIYLDPPFNSNTDYNILFGTENNVPAQMRAFTDTWHWDDKAAERTESILNAIGHPAHQVVSSLYAMLGNSGMLAYLTYMAERLVEMRRLLKPTGSLFLHCDPYASHYLKAVLDALFGKNSFRNEIIWRRGKGATRTASMQFPRNHDCILWYSISDNWHYDRQFRPYAKTTLDMYRHNDHDGKGSYRLQELRTYGKETIERFRQENKIAKSSSGREYLKQYLSDKKGVAVDSVWDDIDGIAYGASKERIGYPTQKPRALLERILQACSSPGDIILDPFTGCGTTIDAAERLGRQWVGIDISSFAIDLVQEYRLKPLGVTAHIEGIPADLTAARRLAELNRFDFESWAIYLVPGLVPNKSKTGDGGIDGRGVMMMPPDNLDSKLVLAQVKSGHFSLSQFRDFIDVVGMEDAALGLFITLEAVSTPDARSLIARQGHVAVGAERYPRVNLWSIQDHFDQRRPHVPPMLDPFTGKPMVQPGLPI